MIKKLEHIGVAVHDIEKTLPAYLDLPGIEYEGRESVTMDGATMDGATYEVAFINAGNSHIELVSSDAKTGLVADFLREKGEGIHHIAFEVDDIESIFEFLTAQGARFVWNEIKDGSRGTRILLLEADAFGGCYVELLEKPVK